MSFKQLLADGLKAWDMPFDEKKIDGLYRFFLHLVQTNRDFNLTALTDEHDAAHRHMLDCLFLYKCLDLTGKRIIDIGTGGGFPGMPLKIYDPSLNILMLDATKKRIDFILQAASSLNLEVGAVFARAEEYVKTGDTRERFDVALSRAVAPLPLLCELCLPYVRPGGLFVPQKSVGAAFEQELEDAKNAIETLGGRLLRRCPYTVGGDTRQLVIIEKIRPTPPNYPRRFSAMTRRPL